VKKKKQRDLHKAFLRYHDPENWPLLRDTLNKMGRSDLIGHGPDCLIPPGNRKPSYKKQERTSSHKRTNRRRRKT
jgi:hypothetical protein